MGGEGKRAASKNKGERRGSGGSLGAVHPSGEHKNAQAQEAVGGRRVLSIYEDLLSRRLMAVLSGAGAGAGAAGVLLDLGRGSATLGG